MRLGWEAIHTRPGWERGPMPATIRINEVFTSIQGESSHAGLPFVFVRTMGCSLRCRWCDTKYAYEQGQERGLDEVISEVLGHGLGRVLLTGGEPLEQAASLEMLAALCDQGLDVLLETNGAEDIGPVDPRVRVVMDLKCPSSEMTERMRWANCDLLKPGDEVKFVIAGRADYEFAREVIARQALRDKCEVLLSVVYGALDPARAVAWMLEDRLPARFQLQLHKYIWDPETRGV